MMGIRAHLALGQFVRGSSRVLLGTEQRTNLQQTIKGQKYQITTIHVLCVMKTYSDIELLILHDFTTYHKVKWLLILPTLSSPVKT